MTARDHPFSEWHPHGKGPTRRAPRWLVFSQMPVTSQGAYVTLQNGLARRWLPCVASRSALLSAEDK